MTSHSPDPIKRNIEADLPAGPARGIGPVLQHLGQAVVAAIKSVAQWTFRKIQLQRLSRAQTRSFHDLGQNVLMGRLEQEELSPILRDIRNLEQPDAAHSNALTAQNLRSKKRFLLIRLGRAAYNCKAGQKTFTADFTRLDQLSSEIDKLQSVTSISFKTRLLIVAVAVVAALMVFDSVRRNSHDYKHRDDANPFVPGTPYMDPNYVWDRSYDKTTHQVVFTRGKKLDHPSGHLEINDFDSEAYLKKLKSEAPPIPLFNK